MRIGPRVWALLGATTLLAAACGGNGGGSDDTAATTPPQPAKITVTATATGDKVAFEVPAGIRPGATEITLVNNLKEPSEFQLAQFDEGHTADEFLKMLSQEGAPTPAWVHALGGVGATQPGQQGKIIVDLKAGKYDWFSTNSSEEENATPQFMRGGKGSLEVAGDPTGAVLPSTPATIQAVETSPTQYGWEVKGLKAGTNQVTFSNVGAQLHHIIIGKLKDGATFDQAKTFFTSESGPTGPPPFDETSFDNTAVIERGANEVETLELQSGTYVFACFITDREGGPPHAIKANMIQEVKVP
jgi:hypothetical protein